LEDTVVWRSHENAFAWLFPSSGGGNPDMTINLEWRAPRTGDAPDAWLEHGRWIDALVSAGNSILCMLLGGFVETGRDRAYRFPVAAIDAKTNFVSEFLLTTPFEGRVPRPRGNYSHITGPDGESWTTYSSFPLWLDGLEIRGNRLVVAINSENS